MTLKEKIQKYFRHKAATQAPQQERLRVGDGTSGMGEGNVFYFEGNYSEYEANKAQRLGLEEPKRARYRKLMEE